MGVAGFDSSDFQRYRSCAVAPYPVVHERVGVTEIFVDPLAGLGFEGAKLGMVMVASGCAGASSILPE